MVTPLRDAVQSALNLLQRGATWEARDVLYAALATSECRCTGLQSAHNRRCPYYTPPVRVGTSDARQVRRGLGMTPDTHPYVACPHGGCELPANHETFVNALHELEVANGNEPDNSPLFWDGWHAAIVATRIALLARVGGDGRCTGCGRTPARETGRCGCG